jgi:hypothetical protein
LRSRQCSGIRRARTRQQPGKTRGIRNTARSSSACSACSASIGSGRSRSRRSSSARRASIRRSRSGGSRRSGARQTRQPRRARVKSAGYAGSGRCASIANAGNESAYQGFDAHLPYPLLKSDLNTSISAEFEQIGQVRMRDFRVHMDDADADAREIRVPEINQAFSDAVAPIARVQPDYIVHRPSMAFVMLVDLNDENRVSDEPFIVPNGEKSQKVESIGFRIEIVFRIERNILVNSQFRPMERKQIFDLGF